MTQQVIDIGSAPDDATGDPLRLSFDKTNENFTELYAKGATEGLWNYNQTSTDTSTSPVSGRFKTNSGNYRDATQIAIHAITIQGIDRTSTLRTLLVGDLIQCQDSTNPAAWCRFGLQSLPVDHGTWFQLNVALQADGAVASGDNQEIVFVFTAGSGGASAGAPADAEYVTSTTNATLISERVLTDTASVTWDRTTAGQIKANAISGGSGGAAEYVFSSNTSAPPSSGQIRLNNATQSSATVIWVHNITNGGVDLKRAFETTPIGAKLIIQDQSDSSKYANYQVTGALVDGGTYWQFPVAFVVGGSALVNQQRTMLSIQTAPAAPGAPVGADYVTSTADATLTSERVLTDTATVTWDRTTAGQIKANAVASGGGTSAPQGRLTLQTLVPVMITTQPAKTTIYYTPYHGNLCPIYDGTNFSMSAFTELSVLTTDTTKSPAAIGASKVNDWFVWSDAGTLRVGHGPDWTSDTARSAGTALVMVNGILLNNAAITNGPAASRGTYVGTTRSNASSQLDWILGGTAAGGTASFLGVWNAYNRRPVVSRSSDSNVNWTYGAASWRMSDNSAGMRCSFVMGLQEDAFSAWFAQRVTAASSSVTFNGIALNGTASPVAGATGLMPPSSDGWPNAHLHGFPVLGFNFVQAVELGGTGATFAGNDGAAGDRDNSFVFMGFM